MALEKSSDLVSIRATLLRNCAAAAYDAKRKLPNLGFGSYAYTESGDDEAGFL